jgi:hypothetical protein
MEAPLSCQERASGIAGIDRMVLIARDQKPVLEIISSKFTEIFCQTAGCALARCDLRNVDPATVPFVKARLSEKAGFPQTRIW